MLVLIHTQDMFRSCQFHVIQALLLLLLAALLLDLYINLNNVCQFVCLAATVVLRSKATNVTK